MRLKRIFTTIFILACILAIPVAASTPPGSTTPTATLTPGTTLIPVASFKMTSTEGLMPLSVRFFDTSSNAPTSWVWDFGDGGTSMDQNPTHLYSNPGNYTVTFTATNSAGGNTTTFPITIVSTSMIQTSQTVVTLITTIPRETEQPTVSFVGTPLHGPAPLSVRFSPTVSGSPVSYAWDFGDGGKSFDKAPFYTYNAPGTYTVTLVVNYAGYKKTSVQEDYITVNGASASSPMDPAVAFLSVLVTSLLCIAISRRKIS